MVKKSTYEGMPLFLGAHKIRDGYAYNGLKLNFYNLTYGNQNGVEIGLVNLHLPSEKDKSKESNFNGICIGAYTYVSGVSKGQFYSFISNKNKINGISIDVLANLATDYQGFQIAGFFARADTIDDYTYQCSCYNHMQSMKKGDVLVQTGLVNIVDEYDAGLVVQIGAFNRIDNQVIPGINIRYSKNNI